MKEILSHILISFGDPGVTFLSFKGIGGRFEIWGFLIHSLGEPRLRESEARSENPDWPTEQVC